MNETINYRIEEFDKILAEETKSGQGINHVLFWAYEMSVENNNNYLNFADTIWPDDIAPIVETCRKYGIKEFSISSTCSGLTTTLADFEKHGCKVCGLTKANLVYGRKTASAIKLQVL